MRVKGISSSPPTYVLLPPHVLRVSFFAKNSSTTPLRDTSHDPLHRLLLAPPIAWSLLTYHRCNLSLEVYSLFTLLEVRVVPYFDRIDDTFFVELYFLLVVWTRGLFGPFEGTFSRSPFGSYLTEKYSLVHLLGICRYFS